jgi:hypothetical protein
VGDDPTDVAVLAVDVARETFEILEDELSETIRALIKVHSSIQSALSRFPPPSK